MQAEEEENREQKAKNKKLDAAKSDCCNFCIIGHAEAAAQ